MPTTPLSEKLAFTIATTPGVDPAFAWGMLNAAKAGAPTAPDPVAAPVPDPKPILIASSNSRFRYHGIFLAEDLQPFPGAYCYVTCKALVGYSGPGDWRIESVACETAGAGYVEYSYPSPQAVFLINSIDRQFGERIEAWVCEKLDEQASEAKLYQAEMQIDDRNTGWAA